MTTLSEINRAILGILEEFQVRELPNLPNILGVLEETTITFAVISGSVTDNKINLKCNISLASEFRTTSPEAGGCGYIEEDKLSLDELFTRVIYKIHKKKISGCEGIRVSDCEFFTPASGKWRALISITIPWYFDYEEANICEVL